MIGRMLKAGCQCIKNSVHRKCISSHSVILEDVHCYGSLLMRCPLVSAHIKPINPHNVADGIKSLITIKTSTDNYKFENLFFIDYNKGTSVISVRTNKDELANSPSDLSIYVEVPHIYNLDINALAIDIEETEGDTLNLHSERHCSLGKIKTRNSNIFCNGAILCKNFFGDGYIKSHSSVTIKKVQSTGIRIDGEQVEISAVYAPDFNCQTDGKINIENVHGTTKLSSKHGPIYIGSSEGDLNIETEFGDVDVTLERCQQIRISSGSGDISIGVGDSVSAFIEAKAGYIDVPEDFLIDGMKEHSSSGWQQFEGRLGDGTASINANTKGSISFSRKSWISKFQLNDIPSPGKS